MEKVISYHLKVNSLSIMSRLALLGIVFLLYNRIFMYISIGLLIVYSVSWGIIAITSKSFYKYFKRMRRLILLFWPFYAPSYFKFDFNPKDTVKKEKYSYDSVWLYQYINKREFSIVNEEAFVKNVVKDFKLLDKSMRRTNITTSIVAGIILMISLVLYIVNPEITAVFKTVLTIGLLVIITLIHNLLMRIVIKRNNNRIEKAIEENDLIEALKYTILYSGMTKKKLYKCKNVNYLRYVETVHTS